MAFDLYQADRIRQYLEEVKAPFYEKKMMGGLIFMVDDKMCVGLDIDKQTQQDRLMVRVGPEKYKEALKIDGARDMNFTGRSMKGFVFVHSDGFDREEDLQSWIDMALHYNPLAAKSKKKSNKKKKA